MTEARRADWIRLMRLVVITSAGEDPRRGHEYIALAALRAGCRAVQLRDKEMSDRHFAELAIRIDVACKRAGALFLVNDRVDVAAAVGCDGVHLGVLDLDVADARRVVGPDAIIGYSPEGMEDALRAIGEGADYLGIGPVFETPSKADAGEPIGTEGLSLYCREAPVPVVAVGGVSADSAASAIAAGAAGVAVMSAVGSAPGVEKATRGILGRLEKVSSAG